jgi:hypothetical protein
MAVSNAPSSRRIRLSEFTMDARCVISLSASIAVVRCETRSSRQRRVGARFERRITCQYIVSNTWATQISFLPSRRRFRHLRPHQSTDYKVVRRKQPSCYSRRCPGTRYLVGDNINTNSSIEPAKLSTLQVPAEQNVCSSPRFVLVVCMFCGRVIPVAALLRRMNQRHATCFEHRSVLLFLLVLDVWSRFCSDAAFDITSRRPQAGLI